MGRTEFADFYLSVHGRAAFPWQERLAATVLATGWPKTIAVPTGCGKTSVLDVAVYALAAQAGKPALQRTAPLRIFLVVDRRLVVDDAYSHARCVAEKIERASDLDWIRDALSSFGGAKPLATAVLRGGMYRSDVWADQPNQPLVCVSTVDQIGSRLLFRGYGLRDARRPIDAGLVGNDSLVIIDEAHLSKPFLDTLGWIQRYQGGSWRKEPVAPGLRLVEMSATVAQDDGAFRLDRDDYSCHTLAMRLRTEKRAVLKECSDLVRAAADEAARMRGVVGVVLNTVASARATYEVLKEALNGKGEAILLTGRVRPHERDELLKDYRERIKAGRTPNAEDRLYVVATQTIEVGADLDFDALVTEAAPIDSLRQRFGRLNRLGQSGPSAAVILKPKGINWVYGEPLEETWKWLKDRAGDSNYVDFASKHMEELLQQNPNSGLAARRQDGPLVFPAHVDAWAQTNPAPAADPEVAPFLHGPEALEPGDVQIVWRADLVDIAPEGWADVLEAAPPMSTEALPLPVGAARKWLRNGLTNIADLEGAPAPQGEEDGERGWRTALIWRGPGKSKLDLDELRPGDTVVVSSSEGGCDRFGWAPESKDLVRDIGDACANLRAEAGGGRYRMRVHPAVLYPNDPVGQAEIRELLERAREEDISEDIAAFARERIPVDWGKPRAYSESGVLLVSKKMPDKKATEELDESDEGDASSLTERRSLRAHTKGVVTKVRQFAEGCGLPEWATESLEMAAKLHDIGKCDIRFQLLLDPEWDSSNGPMAKGTACLPREYRRRLQESGYPPGARHEFASVALAANSDSWDGVDRDLVLHLIGSHHGHGRALAPAWEGGDYDIRASVDGADATTRGVALAARLDSGWTDRYWGMTRKYGWWGLAYLEAILRRADCVQSREEQQ